MAVGAISVHSNLGTPFPAGNGVGGSAMSTIDFAAIIASAKAIMVPGDAVISIDFANRSAATSEAFRSNDMVGHLRMTRIVFTDGTAQVRLDDLGGDSFDASLPSPAFVTLPRQVSIKNLSDLAPEIEIAHRADSYRQMRIWNRKKGAGLIRQLACKSNSHASDQAAVAVRDHDAAGRLIDILI